MIGEAKLTSPWRSHRRSEDHDGSKLAMSGLLVLAASQSTTWRFPGVTLG